jgi:hypothetical protein
MCNEDTWGCEAKLYMFLASVVDGCQPYPALKGTPFKIKLIIDFLLNHKYGLWFLKFNRNIMKSAQSEC